MEEPYYLQKEQESKERSEAKTKNISDRPFNPAQVKKALKHEYPFLGLNEVSTYTFLSQNDPYEASRDEKLRALWIEECKNLYGPFKPSGAEKPLSVIAKSQLRDIVDVLKRLLLSDWNDVNFVIGSKSHSNLTFFKRTRTTLSKLSSKLKQSTSCKDSIAI